MLQMETPDNNASDVFALADALEAEVTLNEEMKRKPHQFAAGMLVSSYQFKEEYYPYLIDQLSDTDHNLVLAKRHRLTLESKNLEDADSAILKFETMSHIMLINDAKLAHRKTISDIPVTTMFEKDEYAFTLDKKIDDLMFGSRIVIVKSSDLLPSNKQNFKAYFGSVEVDNTKVRCSHSDLVPQFGESDNISIFIPPYDSNFEAHQYVIKALKTDPVVRSRFYEPGFGKPLPRIPLRNNHGLDESQLHAAQGIMYHDPKMLFLVQGPPGTGKTWAICTATKEMVTSKTRKKILICAPSNAAADVISTRLLEDYKIPTSQIRRAFAPGIPTTSVAEHLLNISWKSDGRFYIPSENTIKHPDIIVCTISIASRLAAAGKTHFTHIIIDEAGQCLELDAMVPVAYFANEKTCISLVGDQKQLAAFFADGILNHENFDTTTPTIGRLFENSHYRENPNLAAVLCRNYRSHPDFVVPISNLFYGDQLDAANPLSQNLDRFEYHPLLGETLSPMRFHVCRGQEDSCFIDNRKTFFNVKECNLVVQYLDNLKNIGIPMDDIGIVVPYRGQIVKILEDVKEYKGVLVDTVNRFQGNEKSIIIVTLVRTDNIGFLADYRRLNVAISRAKRMMIIIGDLDLLCHDENYRKLALYYHQKGCLYDEIEKNWGDILKWPVMD